MFVFDEAGHFVQQITEEAAPKFAENYTKEIELPGGNYQFVVWGNHYEDETDHNYDDEADLLNEGRMTLTQTARTTEIEMLTDSLFHGCTPQQVTVVNGEDQVVPIDLMKNRNDVRVVVRWREKGMAVSPTGTILTSTARWKSILPNRNMFTWPISPNCV